MNLYRIAYEYPKTQLRGRITFAAVSGVGALIFAGEYCKKLGVYWLATKELHKCEINNELELIS